MALTRQTMTDEQRRSVALEYLKAFDNGGVTSTGGSILDLFAEDAQVYFPKWGLANGKKEIGKLFGDVGGTITSIVHHYSHFNWVIAGDTVVCEGTSHGEHRDGPWRAGVPEWAAEVALRVEDVAIEPEIGLGQPTAAGPGVGQQREGTFGVACRLGHQGEAARGHRLPARIAELARPGEGVLQEFSRSGRVGPG